MEPRRILLWSALVLAVMEFVDAFFIEFPIGAFVFTALLLAGVYWLVRSSGRGPVIYLGILGLFEFLMVLFVYPNAEDPSPAWSIVVFAVVTLVVWVSALVTIIRRPAARSGEPA